MNSLEKIVHFTKKFLDTSLLAGAMTLSAFVGCKQDHREPPEHEEIPPPVVVEPLKMPEGYGKIVFSVES